MAMGPLNREDSSEANLAIVVLEERSEHVGADGARFGFAHATGDRGFDVRFAHEVVEIAG